MRQKDPKLMRRIRSFTDEFYKDAGRFPSTTEIAACVGVSRGTAYRYLIAMDEQGMISYDGGEIITQKIACLRSSQIAEVYTGSIPCGTPESVEATIADYVSLPTSIFGSGEMYVLRTRGDSMIDAGIDDGDLVVVKKQNSAKIRDIVVALHNNENTLKTLWFNKETKRYILHPENKSMEDIEVDNLLIQGVAKYIIKSL